MQTDGSILPFEIDRNQRDLDHATLSITESRYPATGSPIPESGPWIEELLDAEEGEVDG